MDDSPTPRNIAKYVVKALVGVQASRMATEVITTHTNFDEDNKVVELTSGVVGWVVSAKCQPLTDKLVDSVADWFIARKAKKAETVE